MKFAACLCVSVVVLAGCVGPEPQQISSGDYEVYLALGLTQNFKGYVVANNQLQKEFWFLNTGYPIVVSKQNEVVKLKKKSELRGTVTNIAEARQELTTALDLDTEDFEALPRCYVVTLLAQEVDCNEPTPDVRASAANLSGSQISAGDYEVYFSAGAWEHKKPDAAVNVRGNATTLIQYWSTVPELPARRLVFEPVDYGWGSKPLADLKAALDAHLQTRRKDKPGTQYSHYRISEQISPWE